MHEVVVISGKGGAGKTSITGAFAGLARNAILCDLDVDAPDLHLLLSPMIDKSEEFHSGNEAVIDAFSCESCGTCQSMCRFNAIEQTENGYRVDPLRCEGCKVCVTFCPANAIAFPVKHCGTWYESRTRFGSMIHAQLFPGEENSGRLVTLLKQHAREIAATEGLDLVLSDGAPGIGCPVISSLAGTNLAVIVTEPTQSGLHDLKRVAELCARFKTKTTVLINKFDLNPEQSMAIETFCNNHGYPILCRFPHDHTVTEAMVQKKTLTETGNSAACHLLETAWGNMLNLLYE
ncbi:ATP-binding protein [Pseudodesulfovibrio piezophilus]|uniref:Cobyrinic acid ac-diamide synthase n=1 Tax=Pseudodesulfovibrio piezophilus (strain DSM 21447 / JCM 15486 / C1TLV30) TaxID=1322246 RepID=M1WUB7_PSEP2|nr:ATP-binding protein [Pseudodesulfovibrio piezophilus]CCH50507.1 Cobyrinic acid ac-diamide synthase [Pseudodesulfovibrio piezophilus C1TLV30]